MPLGFGARRGRAIRRAGSLSLALSLGAASSGLCAEQRVLANPAGFSVPDAEVDQTSAPPDVLVRPGDPLNEALASLGARLDEMAQLVRKARAEQDALAALKNRNQRLLARMALLEAERANALKLARELSEASEVASASVRHLVAELIARRSDNARLSADLAVAEAERAKIERASRAKEAALTAWIGGLHDELAEREAQLADAMAARAQIDARLEAQARATKAERARAGRELAALRDLLGERERQMAYARTESEDLRRRLAAAQAELERQGADRERLVAELAAARRSADFATAMARDNLATIDDQIGVLHAAAGYAPPHSSEQPGRPVSAMLSGALPAMPYPRPRLQTGVLDAGTTPADALDDEVLDVAMAAIEDGSWIQLSVRDTAAGAEEWANEGAPFVASDAPGIDGVISTAALLADPPGARQADDRSAAEGSTPLLEWGNGAGLIAAAARLAEALRTTREAAMSQREERVLTVDVEQRAFAADPAAAPVPLDPALDIRLVTARSELVGDSEGGIRFYPDGSSTGGRIELGLLGDRAAVNVQWSTGLVTVER